jgi:hypothetical protein
MFLQEHCGKLELTPQVRSLDCAALSSNQPVLGHKYPVNVAYRAKIQTYLLDIFHLL